MTVVATGTEITGGSQQVTITVTDSPPPPALAVTVSAAPTMIAEGDTSTITAMANRPVEAADGTVTVVLVVALGEATLSAPSLTIAAGAQSGTVTLTSTADPDYEDDTVTVVATGTEITGGSQRVTITVRDPPPLAVTMSAAPMTIEEGGMSTITAMANRPVEAAEWYGDRRSGGGRRSHAQRAFAHHRGGRAVRNRYADFHGGRGLRG